MKQFKKIIVSAVIAATTFAFSLSCMDLTPYYRAAHFQGLPKTNLRDVTTYVSARYLEGDTKSSWNKHEKRKPLFADHGPFDLAKMGLNLEGLTEECKPLTHQFLRNITRDEGGEITDGGMLSVLSEKGIGKFEFSGNFSISELDIEVHQNLMYGFYLHAHLPLRDLKICNIKFKHVGCQATDAITAPNNVSDKMVFDTFVANLDPILKENGLIAHDTNYCKNGLTDFTISAGWQGYDNTSFDLVSSVQGYMQIGALIPNSDRNPINRVFWLPDGYGDHFGVNARIGFQANAFEYFGFGMTGGITMLFNETFCRRVPTSCCQRGFMHLQAAQVTVEQGTVWDIGAYIKADHLLAGLSILGGYTYTKQERSFLTVKDCNYLKTFSEQQFNLTPPSLVNRDTVASSDPRLMDWNQHTMHVMIEYDMGYHIDHWLVPQVQFLYNLSILGRNSWPTDMIGGQAQLVLGWTS